MSLSKRITELNRHDLSNYVPFCVGAVRVGSIRRDRVELLRGYGDVFAFEADRVALSSKLDSRGTRTEAMARVIGDLNEKKLMRRPRNESYAVVALDDRALETAPLFEIDRNAVPFFGIRAFGVHVNGYVRRADGFSLWIARRNRAAQVHPGKLDNMVAGGQPASLSPFENMMKEAEEEANIGRDLAARAVATGYISYCVETGEGLGPATMFIFDLELAATFTPENTDGEIEYFELLPMPDVLRLVEDGREFKPNSNLVIIDFCLRHGIVGRDHPEYARLASGLRQ